MAHGKKPRGAKKGGLMKVRKELLAAQKRQQQKRVQKKIHQRRQQRTAEQIARGGADDESDDDDESNDDDNDDDDDDDDDEEEGEAAVQPTDARKRQREAQDDEESEDDEDGEDEAGDDDEDEDDGEDAAAHEQGDKRAVARQKGKRESQRVDTQLLGMYTADKRILTIGDGNFSFSLALAFLFDSHASNLTATVYDSREVVVAKYPEAAQNAEALVHAKSTVLYDVDGTRLAVDKRFKGQTYDCIAFHFPHVGAGIKDQDRNIATNQTMLTGFLQSARAILSPEGHIHITLRRGLPYDLWKVPNLARIAGLRLVNAVKFEPRSFPGYAHRRTIGLVEGLSATDNEEIVGKTLVTYIFALPSTQVTSRRKAAAESKNNKNSKRRRAPTRADDDDADD